MSAPERIDPPGRTPMPQLRVPLSTWLAAVESPEGPLPEELRHVCLTLARFMSGDGTTGAFPGARTLANRVGCSHAAIGRRLKLLRDAGWLDFEPRPTKYGRPGRSYFPAVPMERLSVPIEGVNGTPERSNSVHWNASEPSIGTQAARIGTLDPRFGTPERSRLLLTLTEKSAATPSPVTATGSAARKPDPDPDPDHEPERRAAAFKLQDAGKTDEEIVAELGILPKQAADWRKLRETIRRLKSLR